MSARARIRNAGSGGLARLRRAVGGFLRGFLGLPGSPGAAPSSAMRDPAAARRALEERAAHRQSCC